MKPILYSYWRSSCSYRVRIALNIKDIDYEYRAIHLVQNGGEQFTSDYTQLNPKAEVPFFKDQNIELSQSMAIIQYVDQAYEGDQLFSQNLTEKAVQIQMCEIVNSGIQPLQNLNVMKKIQKDFKLSDPDKMEWSRFWIANGLKVLEPLLQKNSGAFAFQDKISAVDCFLIPQIYNAVRFSIDLSEFPTIQRLWESSKDNSFIQKASPEQQIDAQV